MKMVLRHMSKKHVIEMSAVVGTVRITENTDGTTTIEWTGTEAHIGNKDNQEDPAWERTDWSCC